MADDDDDDDEANKKPQETPEEIRARQQREREEKQRRYDEVRAKIFGGDQQQHNQRYWVWCRSRKRTKFGHQHPRQRDAADAKGRRARPWAWQRGLPRWTRWWWWRRRQRQRRRRQRPFR
ncbi:hypothetical protein PG997_006873 [Apiospora hydei]|uniref:SUZ domain-containing protein n=1 Tax=Apiospora hydei TaxID=1337664 RepID=A0ABR1WQ52_9PEZI